MSVRSQRSAAHADVSPRPRRLVALGAALAVIGSAATLGLASGAPAGAAPKPNYTAGKDTATFTVLGVLDRNCLVSVGGNEIWIKPGDKIDFKSTLAGIDSSKLSVGLVNDLTGKLAGLNVTAKIYTGSSAQTVTVAGGKTSTFPTTKQTTLSAGNHKITWEATSVALLPVLGLPTSLPLSSDALKSGAKLSWTGVVHVTDSAPKCKLGVSTPRVDASAGPIKVTVPQQNVNVPGVTLPNDLPSVGDVTSKVPGQTKTSTAPKSGTSSANTVPGYELPGESVPERVVPNGTGGANNVSYTGGSGSFTGSGNYMGILPKAGTTLGSSDAGSGTKDSDAGGAGPSRNQRTVELASQPGSPTSQVPVLLAILAIIALALVAGTYARLFLLKKSTS